MSNLGEKENYGNVVIIEGIDGIDIWYGNMETVSGKLYDYVEKNAYLGTTKGNILYLAYQKDGKFPFGWDGSLPSECQPFR